MLTGIIPIVFVPFDGSGRIDEAGLLRVIKFELAGGADGIGINGFASEAYKLTDQERLRTAQIAAETVGGRVPLVIGIAAGSTEGALAQMHETRGLNPATYMVLPPSTMHYETRDLVEHYVTLADANAGHGTAPLMVQHSPHIPQYGHLALPVEALAEMAQRAPNIHYFKIEGPGAPERMRALKPLLPAHVRLFGGVGGVTFIDELDTGVSGVIPGVGFNEVFKQAWAAWGRGEREAVREILTRHADLIQAVSGSGHEFSLHARKALALRAGLIEHATVRRPTAQPSAEQLAQVLAVADRHGLRINGQKGS
jgi:dihydrodipicolinate synthase/N-acetylneuraminate lyase